LPSIVPQNLMWVRFKISESQYLAYKRIIPSPEKAPLALILADRTSYPQRGQIENTQNQVDPKTGTLELQARFPNPQHTLLPGQFGRVQVEPQIRKNAVLTPQRAVQHVQNLRSVFTVEAGNKIAVRPVTTGARIGENWIIES